MCILLFLYLSFESGLYSLITNFISSSESVEGAIYDPKSLKQTTLNLLTRSSWIAKLSKHELTEAQGWINFCGILVLIFILHYRRRRQRRVAYVIDRTEIDPSDYTIRLRKVPTEATEEEIIEWVQSLLPNENIVVNHVLRTHKIGRIVRLLRRRKTIIIGKLTAKNLKKSQKYDKKKAKLDVRLKKIINKELKLAGTIFVTLEKSVRKKKFSLKLITFQFSLLDCKMIVKKYRQRFFQKTIGKWFGRPKCCHHRKQFFKGKYIPIERAPAPTDIVWESLGYENQKKWYRRHLTKLIVSALLITSFGLVLGLKLGQVKSFCEKVINNFH